MIKVFPVKSGDTSLDSPTIVVSGSPVLVRSYDLDVEIPIYVDLFFKGKSCASSETVTVPHTYCGQPIVLSADTPEVILPLDGSYYLGEPGQATTLSTDAVITKQPLSSSFNPTYIDLLTNCLPEEPSFVLTTPQEYLNTETGEPFTGSLMTDEDGVPTGWVTISGTAPTDVTAVSEVVEVEYLQLVGEEKVSYFADGADLIVTASDLINEAVSSGVTLRGYTSKGAEVSRPVSTQDFIAKAVITLKPVGAGYGPLGESGVSTTSEAVSTDRGTGHNLDGGITTVHGELVDRNSFYVKTDFSEVGAISIADGSIVMVTVILASAVTEEGSV